MSFQGNILEEQLRVKAVNKGAKLTFGFVFDQNSICFLMLRALPLSSSRFSISEPRFRHSHRVTELTGYHHITIVVSQNPSNPSNSCFNPPISTPSDFIRILPLVSPKSLPLNEFQDINSMPNQQYQKLIQRLRSMARSNSASANIRRQILIVIIRTERRDYMGI